MENQNSTRAVTDFNPEFSTDVICVGEDYSECLTDTIEAFEDKLNTPAENTDPTAEERIAAALEYQVMASLPDEEITEEV